MLRALFLSVGQIGDPAFRAPLLKGAALALLGGLALVVLAGWGVGWLAGGEGWFATAAAAAGGVLALFAAWWLFVPALLAIASVFLDPVAAAVERRHYPGLPPPAGAGVVAAGWYGLVMSARVAGLTLLLLPFSLVLPMVGVIALWGVAAIGLGEGFFEGVAQRRMSAEAAAGLRRARRSEVWAMGGALALLGAVPGLNLLLPVLGTAAMTHLLHRPPRTG
jgi:uncharacterized protein involved in cysteine biosynthesis